MNAIQRSNPLNSQVGITPFGGNSTSSNEAVEIVSASQAKVKFNSIVAHANDLINLNRESRLQTCRIIHNSIHSLITFTDDILKQKESNEAQLVKEFQQAQDSVVLVAEQLKKCKSDVDNMNVQLAKINSHLNGLKEECKKLNNDLYHISRRIEEEKEKRKNAALDTLVPFYALIDGLIKKQPKRMIPGYSAVVGIDSAIHQDKETYEKQLLQLQKEINETNSGILEISIQQQGEVHKKSQIEGKFSLLQSREKSLELEIKRCSKDLSQLRNILLSLKETLAKYHFLKMDVDTIEEYVNEDLLDPSTISIFVNEITQAKNSFVEIMA